MRLTLRNMLAHMDGLLEPEDDEDIRKRIADSELATNLMHRIRDVVRRLRLGAPSLGGRGLGLDPNTVAEYLDHALPDDQVADFEKVCLESDMQLAEVVAAHQVLTVVQVEAVEIDPAARERMYRLPQVAMEKRKTAETRRREKPEVPDYLREPPRKRWGLRTAGVLAAAVCVILAVLAVTGELDPWLQRAGLRQPPQEVAVVPELPEEPAQPAEAVEADSEDEVLEPVPAELDTDPTETEPAIEKPAAAEPSVSEPTEPVLPKAPLPDDMLETPADQVEPPEPTLRPDDAVEAAPEPAPMPGVEEPAPPEPSAPQEMIPEEPTTEEPREPDAAPAVPMPGLQEPVAPEGPEPPPEKPERAPLGRLVSDRQILLQFDPASEVWDRVAMQTAVKSEYPLLALPTYRPIVALTAGVTVQLVGPAQAELRSANDEGLPILEVVYGRLIMQTLGQAGLQMRLALAGREGTVTFTEAESSVALHVYRVASFGDDPESDAARLVANLWTTRGSIVWQTDGGQPVTVPTSDRIALGSAAPEPPEPVPGASPGWVAEDRTGLLDKRASAVLAGEIEADRPAILALREVAEGHRQREVRWLATRCLAYLGQFDPMVAVLDVEDSKAVWFDYVDELRAAMVRSPQLAAAVRDSLRRHYAEDSEKLYRLLWGYSAEELKGNAAAALVDDLEHERLAVRVLSFWNLREITGGAGHFYRPEHTPAKRQQPVQRWRERLASGEIVRKAEQREPEQ